MQALLIIDVQNDYFQGGKSELVGSIEALHNIKKALKLFRAAHLPIVFVQHINTNDGALFFAPNTEGVNIHSEIAPQATETIIIKHRPNSFYQTGLCELLEEQGIDELVVCGMMTHMCIDTTVRAAKDYDIPVTLLYDACATKDLSIMGNVIPAKTVHTTYMASLNGTFAKVINTVELGI